MIRIKKIFFATLLIAACGLTHQLDARRRKNNTKTESKKPQIVACSEKIDLIINLQGIFFTEDINAIMNKIGFATMAGYALSHWRNPIDSCVQALEKMAKEPNQQSKVIFKYQEKQMPLCIVEWQQGKRTYDQIKKEIEDYLSVLNTQKFFSSPKEFEITKTILSIAFDPAQLPSITKPVAPMISILEQLKKNGYKVYGLINTTAESFEAVKKAYPNVIKQFEAIVTSFETKSLKSETKIYEHLIKTHKINPKKALFIDNDPSIFDLARTHGLECLHFKSPKQIKQDLKQHGFPI